ncbi:MAG: hypothetical protein FJX74_22260 [Armatimonadetes bacterium]|nr:hypothetical protein [Armatimonadota bacterium]
MRCLACLAVLLTTLAVPAQSVRLLSDFGDLASVQSAQEALAAAVERLLAEGGGVLVIPEEAPEALRVENLTQSERETSDEGPVVTIIDQRAGFLAYHVAPIGKHQDGTWAGFRVERVLNLGDKSLPHCGWHSAQVIDNYLISGCTSYMATLTDAVTKGADQRLYVDNIRGIWVGEYLNVTSSAVGYAEPYDRITVKSIGWDPERRRNFFTADLEHDHPAGGLVYNKHVVSGLQIKGYSNCDNQTPGELAVERQNYGVGDSFVVSGMFKYMGDVFSGFGDEGGIVYNAETVGEVESFHSRIEAVDWGRDEITYAPGVVQAHTLSNSRPLINLNAGKWVTQGKVRVVSPSGTYKGQTYPGVIGGPANVFNYQGGLIEGDADCPWDESLIGRFFCVTDPTEMLTPDDTSTVGGYATNPSRPIRRWYQIMALRRNEDGTQAIRILRVRWSAVAAGAPTLFRDDNYTSEGHDRPLSYAIAPGAWVYDISQGWGHTQVTGGWLGADHPRRLKLAATGDRGTPFDFEPGDEIEQAIGPDPWQPRPVRIRQFDQIPSTMPSASIEVEQLGRVQVPYCINAGGIMASREQLGSRKDGKPPFGTIFHIGAASNVGIDFGGDVLDTAIMFRQPNGHTQPIRWRNDVTGSSSLSVEPATGDFVLTGGNLDLTGTSMERTRGISGTGTPAANLRGIDVPVPEGATELQIAFPAAEQDAAYAVSVVPSWLTNVCRATKSATGFTVQFSTAAPAGGRLDWVIVR